jgi:uncharacterized delta-60 repeat protein
MIVRMTDAASLRAPISFGEKRIPSSSRYWPAGGGGKISRLCAVVLAERDIVGEGGDVARHGGQRDDSEMTATLSEASPVQGPGDRSGSGRQSGGDEVRTPPHLPQVPVRAQVLIRWAIGVSASTLAAFAVELGGVSAAVAAPGDLAGSFARHGALTIRAFDCSASAIDAVLPQPRGRILAIGSTVVPNGPSCDPDTGLLRTDLMAARLNGNGSPDRSFGSGGVATADLGLGAVGAGFVDPPFPQAARAPEGKVVVAFGDRLARLLPDGGLDPSFGSNGIVILPPGVAQGLAVTSAGKPIVAETLSGPDASSFAVIRYLPHGSPDPSFGIGGTAIDHFGRSDRAAAIAVDRKGRVVVAGSVRSGPTGARNAEKLAVLRLTARGKPDRGFAGDGLATARFSRNAFANALALLPSGKVLAVGRREHLAPKKPPVWALARFRGDGAADRTFSGNGVRTTEFGRVFTDDEQQAVAVAVEADGKAIVAGIPANTTTAGAGIGLARYLPGGGLDRSFGNGGKRWTGSRLTGFACEHPRTLSLLPDRRFAVGGVDACAEEDSPAPLATLAVYQR